ncbi:MAG: terminase small subunit [Candidatus Thiodiazotropha sp. (ex Codakia orbicularis)]|nr:terminase small subunit [Candidatus Thiodiazotropha sp. (ex Codakia orbicularis)]
MSALDKLSQKRQRFCREYIKHFNATKAAADAGYSKKTANQQGPRLLVNVGIQNALSELIQARNERLETDADWVLARLREEVDADVSEILNDDGQLVDPEEWPMTWKRMISSIKVTTRTDDDGNVTVTREIKKNENPRRLELIGKHVDVKAFQDRIAVEGEISLADRMKAADKRIADKKKNNDSGN